jgi:hypothetical protein
MPPKTHPNDDPTIDTTSTPDASSTDTTTEEAGTASVN